MTTTQLKKRLDAAEARTVPEEYCKCPFEYDRAIAFLNPDPTQRPGPVCDRCGRALRIVFDYWGNDDDS